MPASSQKDPKMAYFSAKIGSTTITPIQLFTNAKNTHLYKEAKEV
jgi:hypothetical protein